MWNINVIFRLGWTTGGTICYLADAIHTSRRISNPNAIRDMDS